LGNKAKVVYNPYFYIPFLLWVVAGTVLMMMYSGVTLFTWINGHYTPLLNELMYYATWMGQAEVIVPVLLALMLLPRYRNRWYFALALACNLLPMAVLQVLKSLFQKPRPMHYFEHTSWVHILEHWDRYFERSFPSGHSEGAFSFFCFLTFLLPQRFRAAGLLFFFLALLVCYSRVYLTAHFFADVYAGSIIGLAVSTIAWVVMNKYFKPKFKQTF
jgi:membrane-associated phospholipid phosphatase